MGIKAKKKDFDCQEAESLEFIADTIEDQDTTIKDDEVIYYKAKKIVPRQELKLGMERWEKIEIQQLVSVSIHFRFTFLLDSSIPGSVPDPNLLSSILDLVS